MAFLAAVGLILNVAIATQMGAAALGVFNQIYAIFIVTAQIAAFGLQDSTQKHIAEYVNEKSIQRDIFGAALMLSLFSGLSVSAVIYSGADWIGHVTDSVQFGKGLQVAALGLPFIALNKVFMGKLNGARRMRALAVTQSLRGGGILLVCLAVIALNGAPYLLGLGLFLPECFLTVIFFAFCGFPTLPWITRWADWPRRHFSFAVRALGYGVLTESYIRIDIIMLGFFVSDFKVGIYSFAAMFIEGLYQVAVVVRSVANPIIVPLVLAAKKSAIRSLARKFGMLSFGATGVVALTLAVSYPLFAEFFPDEIVLASYPILIVLFAGILPYSFFVPMDQIFLQAGRPGIQSGLMIANVFMNIVLNAILIPRYGLIGAGAATAAAFLFAGITLNVVAARALGYRGGLIFVR